MIYLKYFVLYSLFGFTFESFVFKMSKENKHSGVLYGPYTIVYGIGGTMSIILNNFLNIINNKYLNIFLCYILFLITCTLIEFLAGHIIHFLLNIDSWDYSSHKYHFGKYICLDYAFIWGLMALIFAKLLNPFFHDVLLLVPNYINITCLSIIILDFIITLLHKKNL